MESTRKESAIQLFLVVIALAGLISRSGLLLTIGGLLGFTYGISKLWGRYALERLEYRRAFSRSRCFPGEEVELTIELTNRKVLPVTYLSVDNEMPEELEITSRKLRFVRVGKSTLRLLFGLAWYQKVIRRYRVRPNRRGYYRLCGVTMQGGDPFGYQQQTRQLADTQTLVVYPRVVPLSSVGLPSRRPFGDLRSANRLFEDPLRFAGVRDYQQGDPLNRVHWKASAAAGMLQVRLLDPSSNLGLCVFVNTWSHEHAWMGTDVDAFEAACMLAASVVGWAVEEGVPVGLFANGVVHEWGLNLRLEPGRGPEVLTHALEGLARLQTISQTPLWDLMADEMVRLSYGTSVVVITRELPEALAGAVLDVQRSGGPVTLIITGPHLPGHLPRLPGVRTYHVPGEEALHAAVLA